MIRMMICCLYSCIPGFKVRTFSSILTDDAEGESGEILAPIELDTSMRWYDGDLVDDYGVSRNRHAGLDPASSERMAAAVTSALKELDTSMRWYDGDLVDDYGLSHNRHAGLDPASSERSKGL